ncbi:hypothetical protein GQ44DRAFT_760223 [Phaeosphaeriaceae sp. PMI808]|nr:hypothetical protein GQ44DRAFT_760223 [Phaeosphaeriaceae sp. PMI808]
MVMKKFFNGLAAFFVVSLMATTSALERVEEVSICMCLADCPELWIGCFARGNTLPLCRQLVCETCGEKCRSWGTCGDNNTQPVGITAAVSVEATITATKREPDDSESNILMDGYRSKCKRRHMGCKTDGCRKWTCSRPECQSYGVCHKSQIEVIDSATAVSTVDKDTMSVINHELPSTDSQELGRCSVGCQHIWLECRNHKESNADCKEFLCQRYRNTCSSCNLCNKLNSGASPPVVKIIRVEDVVNDENGFTTLGCSSIACLNIWQKCVNEEGTYDTCKRDVCRANGEKCNDCKLCEGLSSSPVISADDRNATDMVKDRVRKGPPPCAAECPTLHENCLERGREPHFCRNLMCETYGYKVGLGAAALMSSKVQICSLCDPCRPTVTLSASTSVRMPISTAPTTFPAASALSRSQSTARSASPTPNSTNTTNEGGFSDVTCHDECRVEWVNCVKGGRDDKSCAHMTCVTNKYKCSTCIACDEDNTKPDDWTSLKPQLPRCLTECKGHYGECTGPGDERNNICRAHTCRWAWEKCSACKACGENATEPYDWIHLSKPLEARL